MSKDSLGDRMKKYENVERRYLSQNMPTLIRIDGKAFHTFTKGMKRPFDEQLMNCMWETGKYLCKNIMGCKVAYIQSDEITLLLTDYDTFDTQPWFDKNIQKMCSVSASMATMAFNMAFNKTTYDNKKGIAMFDSRVFNIPKEEVCNCFIWRQQDATRNSIEAIGRSFFSDKELFKVNCAQIQEKLFQEKQINFNDYPTYEKRGVCIVKEKYEKDGAIRSQWVVDTDIPIFTQDRNYIDRFVLI